MDEITAQKKTQELYSSVNNLVKKQNLEIKKISKTLNVKEDVIRNIMREERPVAIKRKPLTAFDIFCAQRRIDKTDENEDVDNWLKLSPEDKSTYDQIANDYNHEQTHETVQYINDENERKHTLKQSIKELRNLCKRIGQECGYQFLIIGIEPNIEDSFSFGTNDLQELCSDKSPTIERIKRDLIDYSMNSKLNDQEQVVNMNDNEVPAINKVKCEQELSEQNQELKSTPLPSHEPIHKPKIITDNIDSKVITNDSNTCESNPIINDVMTLSPTAMTNGLSYNPNGIDRKKKRDILEIEDEEEIVTFITKDVRNIDLESISTRSMVYKYLENKFQHDTKLSMNIPYEDWNRQENFLVSGWPRNVEFKEWDILNMDERKKVFMALNRLQFHVRLDSYLSKERRASKKKRFV